LKPALVTGASGFLGWHVARVLIDRGIPVRAMARRPNSVSELDAEIVPGDLLDPPSLDRAAAGCSLLFHVAADYRLWVKNPAQMYRANVDGTAHLLAAAARAGVERIVYTSTVGCIGFLPDALGDESTPVSIHDMTGHYKRSKWLAEQQALDAARRGLPVVIVNPTAPVGDHDVKPTPTGQTIVDFLRGKMPAFVDTGLNIVDARETAEGHWLACQKGAPGERYILGGENLTLEQILSKLAALSGRPAPSVRLPWLVALLAGLASTAWAELSGQPPRVPLDAVRMARRKMWVSSAKAQRILGFQASGADLALSRACSWFHEHGYC
jgi:dihydroflavonol-4-reductase